MLLMFRLPCILVLIVEIHGFAVIINTGKRMLSTFMTILFSFFLFL